MTARSPRDGCRPPTVAFLADLYRAPAGEVVALLQALGFPVHDVNCPVTRAAIEAIVLVHELSSRLLAPDSAGGA